MKYNLKSNDLFVEFVEKNLDELRYLFIATGLGYYSPSSDFTIDYEVDDYFAVVENWEQEAGENFNEIKREYKDYFKKAVTKYIIFDKYLEYEIRYISQLIDTPKFIVKEYIYDLMKLNIKLGWQVLSDHQKRLRNSLYKAYYYQKKYDELFDVVYKIEKIKKDNKKVHYIINPIITPHTYDSKIEIFTYLDNKKVMRDIFVITKERAIERLKTLASFNIGKVKANDGDPEKVNGLYTFNHKEYTIWNPFKDKTQKVNLNGTEVFEVYDISEIEKLISDFDDKNYKII